MGKTRNVTQTPDKPCRDETSFDVFAMTDDELNRVKANGQGTSASATNSATASARASANTCEIALQEAIETQAQIPITLEYDPQIGTHCDLYDPSVPEIGRYSIHGRIVAVKERRVAAIPTVSGLALLAQLHADRRRDAADGVAEHDRAPEWSGTAWDTSWDTSWGTSCRRTERPFEIQVEIDPVVYRDLAPLAVRGWSSERLLPSSDWNVPRHLDFEWHEPCVTGHEPCVNGHEPRASNNLVCKHTVYNAAIEPGTAHRRSGATGALHFSIASATMKLLFNRVRNKQVASACQQSLASFGALPPCLSSIVLVFLFTCDFDDPSLGSDV